MARKIGLDRRQVIDAAVTVVDAQGLAALSLAKVAADIGVSSPSLYSYVDSLAGLRRTLALEASSRMLAAVREAAAGRTGTAALRAIAHAYRGFAHHHPGLYATLHTTPVDDEEAFAAFGALVPDIAAVLAELGVPDRDAVPLIRTLRSGLHGFVSLEASGGFGLPDDVNESFDALIDVLTSGILTRSRPATAARGHGPRSPRTGR